MAANPLAEKRRLRKLENQRLEEDAKRRQEELHIAHEQEQQRIENERVAEQQRQLYERERVRLTRQAELDRIARLEHEEHATVSRIETQLSNVGAFCAGELVLSDRDALPLSLAVLTPSALETPIPDAPESDTVVFVADTSNQLHAFVLGTRTLLFSASLSSVVHTPSAMQVVCDQQLVIGRVTCVDLRVLFKLYRAAVTARASSSSDTVHIDGAAALAFTCGDAVSDRFASPRGIAFDDTARELFVSDQLHHCVTVYALAPDTSKPHPSASNGKASLTQARSFGSKGHGRAQLQCPSGLDVSHYHVVVCDTGNDRLAVFAKRGAFVCSYGSKGTHDGAFHDIRDVKLVNVRKRVLSRGLPPDESTVSTEQFEIVVADLGNFRIHILTETGAFVRQLSLLGMSEQIAFQRSQLNALRTILLREFAALASRPVALPSLSGTAMTQVYALASRLHPSCRAYARITTAQAQWRDVRARFHHPFALAYAPSSHELVFVDHENATVFVYNADGSRTKWLGLAAQERQQQQCPVLSSVHSVLEIVFACSTDSGTALERRMYVSDPQSHRIAVFSATAASSRPFLFYIGATTYGDQTLCSSGFLPGELQHPTFLACAQQSGTPDHGDASTHGSSLLIVSDTGNHSVSVFDAWSGQFCRRIGAGFGHLETYLDSPQGIAVLHDQWLYVCDQRNHRVQVFDLVSDDGALKQAFGREGAAPGEFRFPTGIAVAAALPQGDTACDFGPHRDAKVAVSDSGNHRVQIFAAIDLQVLLVLDVDRTPFDQRLEPLGVCVEARSGCVLVCDGANKCVLIFRRDGAFIAAFGSTVEPANRFARPVGVTKHDALLLVTDATRCDVCVFELR